MLFKSRDRWISGERIKTFSGYWAKKVTNITRNLGMQPKAVLPFHCSNWLQTAEKKKYPVHMQQWKVPGGEKHIRYFLMTTRKKMIHVGCNSIWQNWKHTIWCEEGWRLSLLPLEKVALLGLKLAGRHLVFFLPCFPLYCGFLRATKKTGSVTLLLLIYSPSLSIHKYVYSFKSFIQNCNVW